MPRPAIDVRCVGFTPGFPFLGGLPAKLATPRRKSPRAAVPAGSVAIGGPQTGIYPLRSPGGWNIIGRTPLRLFDVTREPAALLRAGDRVRFFANRAGRVREMGKISVLRAGPLTSVQDLGRPGYRALGVSLGGALDLRAAQIANLLVGNPTEAGLLEITLGARATPFRRRAQSGLVRRGFYGTDRGARMFPRDDPHSSGRGNTENRRRRAAAARAWLAIGGGIDVPAVLGSRSTDLRSGFGGYKGRALRDGDELSLGKAPLLPPKPAESRPGARHRSGR